MLRIVPQAGLTSLDPIWTTALVTANHGYNVYDTLYVTDSKLQPQPQMVEGHRIDDDSIALHNLDTIDLTDVMNDASLRRDLRERRAS